MCPGTSSTRTSASAAARWSRRKRPTPRNTPIRTTCLQGKWTHLASNKLFFEVADSTLIFNWPNHRKPEAPGISILNRNTGFRYNAPLASSLGQRVASESNQRGSMNYVTGSHAFKVGFTTAGSVAPRLVRRRRSGEWPRGGRRRLHVLEPDARKRHSRQQAVADHPIRGAGDLRRTAEGEPGALRPGSVDDEETDAQSGHPLRLLQRLRSRTDT